MSAALIWFITGLIFLGIDLLLPHLVLMFFGIGAFAACLGYFFGLALQGQLLIFIVVSLLSLVVLRRKLAVIFGGASVVKTSSETVAHPLCGHLGRVSKKLGPDEIGEIEVDGSFWRAKASEPLASGTQVRVRSVSQDDALLLEVQRASSDS
ncbi:MAG: NfeD family protein [Desulfovibrio sp.]|nr:NfeD family protein [Desulfovibrio sp.]